MKRNYISPSVDTMLCPEATILVGSAPAPVIPDGIPIGGNINETSGDAPRRVRVF